MKRMFVIMQLISFSAITSLHGQTAEQLIKNGNDAYEKKAFSDAQHFYEEAIAKDQKHQWLQASFNLGNALYEQKKFDEAAQQFSTLIKSNSPAQLKATSYYNLGNCRLEQKNYESAIDAYKQTLKLNPRDDDARYNLSYVVNLLANQRGQSSAQPTTQEEKQPPKENIQPPLAPEDLDRVMKELNDSENKTVKKLHQQSQQKKKAVRDW